MRDDLRQRIGWRVHILDAVVICLLLCSIAAFGVCIYFGVCREFWLSLWWASQSVFWFFLTFVAYCTLESYITGDPPDQAAGKSAELPNSSSGTHVDGP